MPAPWKSMLGALLAASGCSSSLVIRVRDLGNTLPSYESTFRYTHVGDPKVWPISAHYHPLASETVADLHNEQFTVKWTDGEVEVVCPRRRGFFKAYSCELLGLRGRGVEIFTELSRGPLPEPFFTPPMDRSGRTLRAINVTWHFDRWSFEALDDIDVLDLTLDPESTGSVEVHSPQGAALKKNRLDCAAGATVTLGIRTWAADRDAPWRVWFVPEVLSSHFGDSPRDAWRRWLTEKNAVSLASGTGRSATFTCPETPGTLALDVEGDHPTLLGARWIPIEHP